METLLYLCRKAWCCQNLRSKLFLAACFFLSAFFSSGLKASDIDSLSLASLDARIKEYVRAIEMETAEVKMAESDFLIGSCSSEELRNHVTSRLYSHFLESKLMGDDAVAVHIVDKWLITGKARLYNAVDMLNARIFADFNRSSLIGRHAPSLNLENPDGERLEILGILEGSDSLAGFSDRLRVLYFYTAECPRCKVESYNLKEFLKTSEYSLDVFFIYTGDDRDKWEASFSREGLDLPSSVRIFNFWDPGMDSGFQRKYGILKTPGLFLINKEGVIIGRGLDTEALKTLLEKTRGKYSYGSEESVSLFDKILSSMDKPSPSDLIGVAAYIDTKLSVEKEELFKKMAGDYLYYLAGKRGEAYKIAQKYVIDSLVLSKPEVWKTAEDSLNVVGFAQVAGEMLSRSAVGSLAPDVKVSGVLKKHKKQKRGVWDLRKLRRDVYVVFYTDGCKACAAELQLADSFMEAKTANGRGASMLDVQRQAKRKLKNTSVLFVNMDEIMSSDIDMAFNILDTFDLSVLPYITFIDRKGIVRRKYMSFVNE